MRLQERGKKSGEGQEGNLCHGRERELVVSMGPPLLEGPSQVELPAATPGFVLAMCRPVHCGSETGNGCSGDWDCHRFGGF